MARVASYRNVYYHRALTADAARDHREEIGQREKVLVYFTGSIAVGKTSLMEAMLLKFPQVTLFSEPVDSWTEEIASGDYQSSLLYRGPKNGGMDYIRLEMVVFADHVQTLLTFLAAESVIALVEREPFSVIIFARAAVLVGIISIEDCLVLEHLVLAFLRSHPFLLVPDLLVFMDAPPDVLKDRITQRGRAAEIDVSLSYMEALARVYRDWAYDEFFPLHPLSTIRLDVGSRDVDNLARHVADVFFWLDFRRVFSRLKHVFLCDLRTGR